MTTLRIRYRSLVYRDHGPKDEVMARLREFCGGLGIFAAMRCHLEQTANQKERAVCAA